MEPRPAATVILARPSDEGVEVLVLTRGEDSRFLPGFTVFPGGTIEPEDYDLAARLFGDSGQAARACALRELYEEAAILLTSKGQIARAPDAPLDSIAFDPPAQRRLVEVARWVAPDFLETRFDATFFAASAARGIEPVPDLAEVSDARWATPRDVLDAGGRGTRRSCGRRSSRSRPWRSAGMSRTCSRSTWTRYRIRRPPNERAGSSSAGTEPGAVHARRNQHLDRRRGSISGDRPRARRPRTHPSCPGRG